MPNLRIPAAAFGVILQRGVYDPKKSYSHLPTFDKLRSAFFDSELKAWLNSPDKEEFMVFSQRIDGRRENWFLRSEPELLEYLDAHLQEYRLRQTVSVLMPIAQPALTERLSERIGKEAEAISRVAPPNTQAYAEGISVSSHTAPGGEHILLLRVSADLVARQQVHGPLSFLDSLVHNAGAIKKNWMRLRLVFDGFDNDPREIFEIVECRQFLSRMITGAPWLLGIVHPVEYQTWMGGLSEVGAVERQPQNTVRFKIKALGEAISLDRTMQLLRCANLPLSDPEVSDMVENLSVSFAQFLTGMDMGAMDPFTMAAHRRFNQ